MTTAKKSSKVPPVRKSTVPLKTELASEKAGARSARSAVSEMSTDAQSVLASLPKSKRALGAQLKRQLATHAVMQLRAQVKRIITASNVDTSASELDRATTFLDIVRDAVRELDGSNKDNVVTFLVRTAWHEGAALTKRVQSAGGPARSFMQMEPGAAKDGVTRASKKGWLDSLATASGNTEADLKSAAAALSLGDPWPAGNLIEEGLKSYDLFGVEVARAYLSAGADPIPIDLAEQADYWESDWHRVTDSAKKAQWLANAKKVNKLLGWT
jgi:hypothetical protein